MHPTALPRTNRNSFAGKTVLITGASSGLGLALARAFARAEANLVLVSRSKDKLKTAAASLDTPAERLLIVEADVARPEQIASAVTQAIERFRAIHVLISCAGQGVMGPFADLSAEDVRNVVDTNFLGSLNLARAAIPGMREQRDGQIVFISSILGLRGLPRSSIYSASKFAVMGLAESLRLELRADGIRVLVVCPGRIDTPFLDTVKSSDGKKGLHIKGALDPDYVARKTLDAIRSRKRMLVLPLIARLVHWGNLWFPCLLDRIVLKRFQKDGLL